ncbi:MAG: methyltransferase domain-containing protein [Thermodesulfobacteriota bacterium]
MNLAELEQRLQELGPWNFLLEMQPGVFTIPRMHWKGLWHNIVVQDYIAKTLPPLLTRFSAAPPAETSVIDIGCNEGWLSWLLFRLGYQRILGIDSHPANINKALFLKDYYRMTNVDFLCADINTFRPEEQFDLALMLGVINHIHNPVGVLENIHACTRGYLFLDFDALCADYIETSPEPKFDTGLSSVYGNMRCYFERSHQMTSTTDNHLVFQYSPRAVLMMLNFAGFSEVVRVLPRVALPPHYKNDKRVFFIARKSDTPDFLESEILLDRDYAESFAQLPDALPTLMEEGYRGFNLIGYGNFHYGIPQGEMEDFDILAVVNNKRYACAKTLARVKQVIDRHLSPGGMGWLSRQKDLGDDADRDLAKLEVARDLIRQSRLAEARGLLTEVLERPGRPGSDQAPSIYYELGRIAGKEGKLEEARKYWEKCLALDPDFHRAKGQLARLAGPPPALGCHTLFD